MNAARVAEKTILTGQRFPAPAHQKRPELARPDLYEQLFLAVA
jgi:hypothetical protein